MSTRNLCAILVVLMAAVVGLAGPLARTAQADPPIYTVTVNQTVSGTVTVTPSMASYFFVATATANPGYTFAYWTANNSAVLSSSTANPTTITPDAANTTITPNFTGIVYEVSGAVTNSGGLVSVSTATGTIGQVITLSQTPSPGCIFDHWTMSGSGATWADTNSTSIIVGSGSVLVTANYINPADTNYYQAALHDVMTNMNLSTSATLTSSGVAAAVTAAVMAGAQAKLWPYAASEPFPSHYMGSIIWSNSFTTQSSSQWVPNSACTLTPLNFAGGGAYWQPTPNLGASAVSRLTINALPTPININHAQCRIRFTIEPGTDSSNTALSLGPAAILFQVTDGGSNYFLHPIWSSGDPAIAGYYETTFLVDACCGSWTPSAVSWMQLALTNFTPSTQPIICLQEISFFQSTLPRAAIVIYSDAAYSCGSNSGSGSGDAANYLRTAISPSAAPFQFNVIPGSLSNDDSVYMSISQMNYQVAMGNHCALFASFSAAPGFENWPPQLQYNVVSAGQSYLLANGWCRNNSQRLMGAISVQQTKLSSIGALSSLIDAMTGHQNPTYSGYGHYEVNGVGSLQNFGCTTLYAGAVAPALTLEKALPIAIAGRGIIGYHAHFNSQANYNAFVSDVNNYIAPACRAGTLGVTTIMDLRDGNFR